MEFDEVVKTRRSVRAFAPVEVSDGLLRGIIASALQAPSSMNGQPWSFVVVRNPETKRQLAEIKNRHCPAEKAAFRADFLAEAPVLIVTCVERARAHDRGVETAVLATAHLLLAAAERGLGSVYLSAYRPDAPELAEDVRRLLEIPADVDPVTLVPLGYPAEVPPSKEIRSLDEVLHFETFGHR